MVATLLVALCLSSPTTLEEIDFIGFSRNEKLAAWRSSYRLLRQDGNEDNYVLIHVARTDTGEQVASIRHSAIRTTQRGAAKQHLVARNSPYAVAWPERRWPPMARSLGFRRRALEMNTATVRLLSRTPAHIRAERWSLLAEGKPGAQVAYDAYGRLFDGSELVLGRYNAAPRTGAAVTGRLEAFFSPSGYQLAVINRFQEGTLWAHATLELVRTVTAPIGTTRIGTLRMISAHDIPAAELLERQRSEALPAVLP